mmetsp:Transcript_29584/g.96341  ORF Transcript_29584/g.96341 Transcript_29584/m.96341 type:complete len:267 (-) Transcript_29584:1311-2111(-)
MNGAVYLVIIDPRARLELTSHEGPVSWLSASSASCASHMRRYVPTWSPLDESAMSSTCVPISTMRPSSKTIMRSQCRTVLRRWATKKAVRPSATALSDSRTEASVLVSSAEVASSQSRRRGLRRKARAHATRCFSPPLSLTPRSPTSVSIPLGIFSSAGVRDAASVALTTSSSLAEGRPYATFHRRVLLKSTVSCGTTEVTARRLSSSSSRTSCPSMLTLPRSGSYCRRSSRKSVLLPDPDVPTIPTLSPGFTSSVMPLSTWRSSW